MTEIDFSSQPVQELHVEETILQVIPKIHYLELSAPGPQGPQGPAGPAGAPGGSRYTHTQTTPASVWMVNHNLGYEPLFCTVIVGDEDITWAVDITHTGLNTLTVGFSQPVAGKAAFL